MKKSIKASPYGSFSTEPIKAPVKPKNQPKSTIEKKTFGGDLRAKGDK